MNRTTAFVARCLAIICLALAPVVFAVTVAPEAIVLRISSQPSETERFASYEIARYLKKMTGKKLAVIQTEKASDGAYVITIGRACGEELTRGFNHSVAHIEHDAFVIETSGAGTRIAGNSDRGTLYGAYQFLEDSGCRWFFPGRLGECIPTANTLSFVDGKRIFIPDFNQRTIDVGATDQLDFAEIIDWAAKNRLNFIPAANLAHVRRLLPPSQHDIWSKRGGQQDWQFHVHNLSQIFPNTLFDEHPEYFALYKGARHKMGTPGRPGHGGGNICTTNPEVIQRSADFVIHYFDTHPEGMVVPLWPLDGGVIWCECPNCKKLGGINFMGGRRGSMTRRMVTFGNAVAKKVAEKYPDRWILVPAYANYIQPIDVVLEPNVMLQYCLHGDYAHGIDKCKYNDEERNRLNAWAKISRDRLGVWEYFLLGDHISGMKENPAMLPVLYRVRDTLPYFKSIGMNNYMTQCHTKYWKHNMAAYYVTARYAWSTKQDFKALLKDFCDRMYGAAGADVCAYYTLIEDTVEKSDWHPTVYSDIAVPSVKVFTPSVVNRLDALLKHASGQTLAPIERERLAIVQRTFRHIRENVSTQNMLGLDSGTAWGILRERDAYVMNPGGREWTADDIKRMELNAADGGGKENEFKRILFRARKRTMPVIQMANGTLAVAVIPELGGRIIRMTDRASNHNYFHEPKADPNSSIGDAYFNYGGYEEYIGRAFAARGWENAYTCERQSERSVKLTLSEPDLRLERVVSLPDGDKPVLRIVSRLTNVSDEPCQTALRAHPAIHWTQDVGDVPVSITTDGAHVRTSAVNALHDLMISCKTNGACVMEDKAASKRLSYHVKSAQGGSLYVCKTANDVFNLEFIGNQVTLKPGESIELEQIYTLEKSEK